MMLFVSIIISAEQGSGHNTFALWHKPNPFGLLMQLKPNSVSVDALKDSSTL